MIPPTLENIEEWGTRTWHEFNAAESLSAHLVATILHDQATQIRNPDFLRSRRMFTHSQWPIVIAAAPPAISLCLPSYFSKFSPFYPHIRFNLDSGNRAGPSSPLDGGDAEVDWNISPMWFRGCIILLCHRLDTVEFVKAEIFRMVQVLKAAQQNEGTGIIFDGQYVVGVTAVGTFIRHSRALPVYNHQLKLRDGFRLMMHLLSPCLLTEKVPWRPSTSKSSRSPLPLHTEIIVRVIQLVDGDTYNILPMVSYAFYHICFTYPHLSNFMLLRATSGGAFHAFDTVDQQACCVRFRRHLHDPHDSSHLIFRHRQPKIGPAFFTVLEYESAALRDVPWPGLDRRHEIPLLHCLGMKHIIDLKLQLQDMYVQYGSETPIPEDVETTMQVVFGNWSIEKTNAPGDDEVWHRYHVARDSRVR